MNNTMNVKTQPSLLSDMLINNFGHIMNDYLTEAKVQTKSDFSPALELHELDDSYLLKVALPGISKENISISQEENRVRISGEHTATEVDAKKLHSEFRYGKFSREVRLPKNVNLDSIKASFDHGVLSVVVAKKPETKAKAIDIE
jgi:HSP20 family protein